MATSTPLAYNLGAPISGTTQVGNLAIGTPTSGFTNSPQFWNGPDEDLGWVIAFPVSGNTHPTPVPGVNASLGFYRTSALDYNSFINLSEYVALNNNTPQTFSSATDASTWLTSNGYWNSWVPQVYGFMEMDKAANKAVFSGYMSSQGSTFLGFGTNSPSTVQATFDAQMNAYISYTGWTGNFNSPQYEQPLIRTSLISPTSGGNDPYGNPVVAYEFQTLEFPNGSYISNPPPGDTGIVTIFVPINALNGQNYSTIWDGITSSTIDSETTLNSAYYNLVINYSGNTNIPAGTYTMYTCWPDPYMSYGGNGPIYLSGGTLI